MLTFAMVFRKNMPYSFLKQAKYGTDTDSHTAYSIIARWHTGYVYSVININEELSLGDADE
jgi:hypothetical protein